MPLPSSGPLSLTDIQTEFGGSNPIGLNEYYAGGGLVPAGTTGTNGAVPSSGTISIFNFYGTSNVIPYWTTAGNMNAGWNDISVDSSNFYSVFPNSGFTLFKFNKQNGAIVWARQNNAWFNQSNPTPKIVTDGSGNIFVFTSFYTSAAAYLNIAKYDSSGNVTWQRVTNNPYSGNQGASPVLDSDGNVFFASCQQVNVSNNNSLYKINGSTGAVIWVRNFSDPSIGGRGFLPTQLSVDSSKNIYVFGSWISNAGSYTAGIYKLDTNGNKLDAKTVLITGASATHSMGGIVDSSGNIYVGVYNANQFNNFSGRVVKLNSNFTVSWERQGGLLAYDFRLNNSQNLFFLGQGYYPFGGFPNYAINGISSSGTTLFSLLTEQTSKLGISGNDSLIAINGSLGSQTFRFPQTSYSSYYPTQSSTSGIYFVTPGFSFVSGSAVSLSTPTGTVTNLSDTTVTSSNSSTNYTSFTISASNSITSFDGSSGSNLYLFPGTYTWICPAGVTSVSALCIGGGAGGGAGGYNAGGGGALAYRNNISVTPGSSYTLRVGNPGAGSPGVGYGPGTSGENSYFYGGASSAQRAEAGGGNGNGTGGGVISGSGGNGGNGGNGQGAGGGGAGGYSGSGGTGGNQQEYGQGATVPGGGGSGGGGGVIFCFNLSAGAGGGFVGVIGQGASGVSPPPGTTDSGSFARFYIGGGGGSGGYNFTPCPCCPCAGAFVYTNGADGRFGAVRIIWPGNTRTFPSTNVTTP